MEIKKADFTTSMALYQNYEGIGMPEIAIAGKSNVGKSSMINKLCQRNKLARTSSTPGKTRLLNVYTINETLQLIDLPGYGFAKVAKAEKLRWVEMMEGYFAQTTTLRHVLHLVDIRHDPTQDDRDMNTFLRASGIPFTVRGCFVRFNEFLSRSLSVFLIFLRLFFAGGGISAADQIGRAHV